MMGWGRKRKRKAAIRLFLTVTFIAAPFVSIVTSKTWKAWVRQGFAVEKESAAEASGMDAAEEPGGQQGLPAVAEGKETETAAADADNDTEAPAGADEGKEPEDGTDADTEKETAKGAGWEPTETEKEQETETERKYAVTVGNKEEFAGQVMASRAYLLDKYLSGYVEKKKLKADEGTILDVAAASDNARCTEFYVELNNKKKSLVTLRWDPYTCTVTAAKCQYTRTEIERSVWADGSAAVTDISREEDAAVMEAQGAQTEETVAESGNGGGKEVVLE